jgi:hypothetical protein
MNSRFNWMNIALGGFFCVCLLLAILYGGYQRDKAVRASLAAEQTTQQVAVEVENLRRIRAEYKPLVTLLGAEDNGREDSDFFALLQSIMRAANVRQVSAQRVALETLPTIGGATTPNTAAASSTTTDEAEKAKLNLPSLTNLPLQARAVTTRIEVQGQYANLRNFIGQVHNFRYKKRAINVNSVKIAFADEKGTLQATLNLTRFIYPKQTTQPTLSTDPLSEAIRNRATSGALEMGRPDKPAPARPVN